MTPVGAVLFFLVLLAAGFYGGVETGAYTLSRLRLTMRLAKDDPRAHLVDRWLQKPSDTIAMCLVGQNLCVFAATAILTEALSAHANPEVVATLILAPLVFLFADTTPKCLFARNTDLLFYKVVPLIWLSRVLLYPAVVLLRLLSRFWQAVLGGEPENAARFLLTPAYLTYLFTESKKTGRLSDYQTTLAFNIIRLAKLPVQHAMIPLERVSSFPVALTPAEFLRRASDSPYTRFPVFDGDSDRIVGVVNVIDLALDTPPGMSLAPYIRRPVSVTHTSSVLDALHAMRPGAAMLAVVTRDDTPIGIVTFKDLAEEIAGELREW